MKGGNLTMEGPDFNAFIANIYREVGERIVSDPNFMERIASYMKLKPQDPDEE